MTIDELMDVAESYAVGADTELSFPHVLLDEPDGLAMLALDLAKTSDTLLVLRDQIATKHAQAVACILESWGTEVPSDEIIRRYGMAARRNFALLPPEARFEDLIIYAENQAGEERWKRWRITGAVPNRVHTLVESIPPWDDPKTESFGFTFRHVMRGLT
jgi:hypothetical protein